MNKKRFVLIVDRDTPASETFSTALRRAGFSVLSTDNVQDALSLLQMWDFDVLITDVLLARANDVDLIDWARGTIAQIEIVALSDFESDVVRRSALTKGADLYLHKPVDADEVVELLLASRAAETFSGEMAGIDILEYVQFVMLVGKDMVVQVFSRNGERAEIFLNDGKIVHAACGDLEGEAALYECLAFKGGRVNTVPWREPNRVTIDRNGESLLFEAARRRDEQDDSSGEGRC